MSLNLITYATFIPIIFFVMIKVGWLFYKNGEVFLLHLYNNDNQLVKNINNILLIGYYLTNLGYAIISISFWEQLVSVEQMLYSLTLNLGKIIFILAIMHYNNIFWLKYLVKSKILKQ